MEEKEEHGGKKRRDHGRRLRKKKKDTMSDFDDGNDGKIDGRKRKRF